MSETEWTSKPWEVEQQIDELLHTLDRENPQTLGAFILTVEGFIAGLGDSI